MAEVFLKNSKEQAVSNSDMNNREFFSYSDVAYFPVFLVVFFKKLSVKILSKIRTGKGYQTCI